MKNGLKRIFWDSQTRRLRALPHGAGARVLLTSASVISFDAAEARAAGCDDFLPKPFRTEDLIEKLGALLSATDEAGPEEDLPTDGAPATRGDTPVDDHDQTWLDQQHDAARHVRQAEIAPLKTIGQLLVIKAKQVH